jgi:uncharacterized protein (UPF0333 family)
METNKQIVEQVVRELAQTLKQQAYDAHAAYLRSVIEDYKQACAATGKTCPHDVYAVNGNMRREVYRQLTFKQAQIRPFIAHVGYLANDHRHLNYSLLPNLDEIVAAKSEAYAKMAIESFVLKLTKKLTDIVESKEIAAASLQGSLRHNSIYFTFKDGSSFNVDSNIVHVVNSYGTWFQRYPTTFHNVVLKGERLKSPSEASVRKAFTGIDMHAPPAKREDGSFRKGDKVMAENFEYQGKTISTPSAFVTDDWMPGSENGVSIRFRYGLYVTSRYARVPAEKLTLLKAKQPKAEVAA